MIKPVYLYKVKVFDFSTSLNLLKQENIKIYQLKKIEPYTYTFYSSIYHLKKLQKIFMNIEVIKQTGYFSIILSLLKYKTTLLAMILSVFFYFSLANKIWVIQISGDASSLTPLIQEQLTQHQLYIGAKKVDVDTLSKIQNKILYDNFEKIEYLSISSNGSALNVFFKKKRKEITPTEFKGSLYAKRDGVIKSFDLLSGEKVVKINDYVKTGDLLIKDILTTDYNQEIYIGTYGHVYAYTWYYITIDQKNNMLKENDATIMANLLLNIKADICKNFTESEYIYEENVLQFKVDRNTIYMKLHFTCVEDIAKE